MINLKEIFSRNFKRIFIPISIFILLIIIVQILNYRAKINNSKESIEIEDSKSYTTRNTVLSETKVDKKTNNEIVDTINNFINACNDKRIEEAYNMLSSDCKNQIFPTKKDFEDSYYNIIFKSKRQFDIQSWITKNSLYTYKVKFLDNMLSTGGKEQDSTEDYYTIVKENNVYKLNINNFIGKKDINKSEIKNNINIEVKEVYIYIDYEIYNINIYNDNLNNVLLDTRKRTDTMYVTDNKNNNYASYNYEISDTDLSISSKTSKKLNIKFSKGYNSRLTTEKLTFGDINIMSGNSKKGITIEIAI